ncbi:hypothetical protein KP509_35G048900 [Ceratopteris richardii]|uniref:Uncharacterized protein n=1 Tax=Ceratopteris richardii TaxID=49495 RepID=A0A8T2QFE0_CERRI|nr:hypothetical protein KP509_35G048900 [Ceratopteris richardii]
MEDASAPPPSPFWYAVHRTIQSIGQLSNFLPTGTALVFQFILPIVSENGQCPSTADIVMTATILGLLAILCFFMSFTDTYIAPDGSRYYGVATPHGLWIPDGPHLDASTATSYKLCFADFVRGFLSIVVFIASSLFDPDVMGCFHCIVLPPSLQLSLPISVAFFASLILCVFPSKRHGFDYPPTNLPSLTTSPHSVNPFWQKGSSLGILLSRK